MSTITCVECGALLVLGRFDETGPPVVRGYEGLEAHEAEAPGPSVTGRRPEVDVSARPRGAPPGGPGRDGVATVPGGGEAH
jgi:hypothetical protein